MTRAGALLLLAGLAALPSIQRILAPPPRPLLLRPGPETPEADRLLYGEKMDLNQVDPASLRIVPGIGPALARRIVDDRTRRGPFRTLGDVERVRGVGPAKRRALADYCAVPLTPRPAPTSRTRPPTARR